MSSSWTGDVSDTEDDEKEVAQDSQEESVPETDDTDTDSSESLEEESGDTEEVDSSEASETAEPEIETVDDMIDEDSGDNEESSAQDSLTDSDSPPTPTNAISVDTAADRDRRWKVLVWGEPGLFKSHFAYTAPEPIAYIDTERKAHDIAHKFSDKEIQIWQPETFRETQEALDEALDWLRWYLENEDTRGTIVVDSMSLVWEWAKTTYKKEAYPMKDEEAVNLSSNIGSSAESDWAHIKGMHNAEFREIITDSPFHFVWTAMETEDFAAAIEGDGDSSKTPVKAEGEKNNVYKADTIIHAREGENGEKVGDVTKSSYTEHHLVGMERPTFPKLENAVEELEDAEVADRDIQKKQLEDSIGAEVVRGDPSE